MIPTCYQCQARHKGCHAECRTYAAYREIRDRMLQDNRRNSMLDEHIARAKKNFRTRN